MASVEARRQELQAEAVRLQASIFEVDLLVNCYPVSLVHFVGLVTVVY